MSRSASLIDTFVGARVAARRIALGLTQSALASRLGVTFQQIQKYESGANRVSASRLHRIAEVLGVAVGHFFPRETSGRAEEVVASNDDLAPLQAMMASVEGRSVMVSFSQIEERSVRLAISRIVEALARSPNAR